MKKIFFLLAACFFIGLSACSPAFATTDISTQDPARLTAILQTQVAQIVAGTEFAQTQTAGSITSAFAMQTGVARGVAYTLTAMVTETPVFTFTPVLTPTFSPSPTETLTPTPNYPRVTLGADSNCRSGPGLAYEILGLVKAGQTAEIVGQDVGQGYWIIRLPSNPVVLCWIWRASATVTGNAGGAPIFTPQPTPTETIDFLLTYDSLNLCSGNYALKFKIVNDSRVTWESDQVNVTDQTTNVTTTINRNNFTDYEGCNLVANDSNLAPGETGFTLSNSYPYNPAGHSFKATLQLCSTDGQVGTCAVNTITFIP